MGTALSFPQHGGQFDAVVISEAPDDETVAKLSLAIGSKGAIRTVTSRAFEAMV